MVVELDGRLDESRLVEAIGAVIEAEPVLACRVQDRFFRPRWVPGADRDAASLLRVIPSADPPGAIRRLLLEALDPWRGPVVRFALVRGERDAVVVNLDHSAGDAASVRALTYLLASLYGRPRPVPPADRAAYFAKRTFGSLRPLMPRTGGLMKLLRPPPPAEPSWRFPWRRGVTDYTKKILVRRLSPPKAAAVRTYAATRNAWLNDVFLAAYFRALAHLVGIDAGVPRLTVPVDLRAYLSAAERPRIANFSASFEPELRDGLGGSLDETLALVRAATEREKQGLSLIHI